MLSVTIRTTMTYKAANFQLNIPTKKFTESCKHKALIGRPKIYSVTDIVFHSNKQSLNCFFLFVRHNIKDNCLPPTDDIQIICTKTYH